VNILLVTFDQLRSDVVADPEVATPALDALRAEGVFFANHYAQAAPCSPGRAALYTGTYQMNNRVVANGSPLDDRFDNVARMARRAGFDPHLFGYTDTGLDPRQASGPDDPRLDTYEGILPGFSQGLWLPGDQSPWLRWLADLGHDPGVDFHAALATEPDRPAEHSISAFLTDGLLGWLHKQSSPWFAHLSYLRPHPPYAAAGEFAELYDPAAVGSGLDPVATPHWLHDAAMSFPASAAPKSEKKRRHLRAQYLGMVSEVDSQFGRVMASLKESGSWEDTMVIVTADHGEQLCDHGLVEKLGFFEESYRIPCIIRDPRLSRSHGTVVDSFTENIDILPTIASALSEEVPTQCDGMPLQPFLEGIEPAEWRRAAHYEWDWRHLLIGTTDSQWPMERTLERQNLAVVRNETMAYVHFGDGSWLCFDLASDPTWRTTSTDPALVLAGAQEMLTWRQEHLDRTFTDMLLTPERAGRWPSGA